MQGFITESELTQADQEFPGIEDFFAALPIKPRTFLELVARFEHWCEHATAAATTLVDRTRA